jgi:altronate hydrolase
MCLKFATEDLSVGDDVVMYGVLVGAAVKQIQRGERLTTSNVQHHASAFHEQASEYHWTSPEVARWQERTFLGYHRSADRWVQETTGLWFRWCFVKTGTLAS